MVAFFVIVSAFENHKTSLLASKQTHSNINLVTKNFVIQFQTLSQICCYLKIAFALLLRITSLEKHFSYLIANFSQIKKQLPGLV